LPSPTLSLHDALPISAGRHPPSRQSLSDLLLAAPPADGRPVAPSERGQYRLLALPTLAGQRSRVAERDRARGGSGRARSDHSAEDRKSTRLNSSHGSI